MIANFYVEIANRLATAVPEFKVVTLQNDQVNAPGSHDDLPTPYALIEFSSIVWENETRGGQSGDAVIAITVAGSQIGDFNAGSLSQTPALESLFLLERVHRALQGWSGNGWSAFSRTSTEVDHRRTSVVAHTMVYNTRIVDTSTDPFVNGTMIIVYPNIIVHRDVDLAFPADASVD